ncbi:MAG: ATP-binding cassette domain-containing protein, partial [Thermaerobacter sp.]|nr:ATP-binding cassette domain-containing protein [Thermaerobacter sp.]
ELVGLRDRARMKAQELSGGEQQRVAIARAMVHGPPLLIADEPTGNLDPATAWEVMQLLVDVNHRGTTVVVASHAKALVDALRRRVVELAAGRVVRDEVRGLYVHEA